MSHVSSRAPSSSAYSSSTPAPDSLTPATWLGANVVDVAMSQFSSVVVFNVSVSVLVFPMYKVSWVNLKSKRSSAWGIFNCVFFVDGIPWQCFFIHNISSFQRIRLAFLQCVWNIGCSGLVHKYIYTVFCSCSDHFKSARQITALQKLMDHSKSVQILIKRRLCEIR